MGGNKSMESFSDCNEGGISVAISIKRQSIPTTVFQLFFINGKNS